MLDYLSVPLTSVHVPKFEIGQQAAKILLRQIDTHKVMEPQRISFDAELVVRGSTRSLNGSVPEVEIAEPAGKRRAVGV